MAPAGPRRRHGEEPHGAPSLAGEQDRQARDRAQGQRELRGRRAVRGLNRDLLQLRRRAGGDGSPPRAGTAPSIRETVFGRDAGHERGDDHVIRACDAIERESGKRRGGKSRARSAGCGRAGRESGRAECELDRGPGRRGRFRARAREGRRAEAEDTRRRPRDVAPPSRFRPDNASDAPRQLPQPTLRPPAGAGRSGGPCPGSGGAIGHATYAVQSFISTRRRSNRSLRR